MTRLLGKDGYIGSTLDLPDSDFTVLLAGHSSVKMCDNAPDEAWVNNVEFFRSVLRNSKKLIYASSASVLGEKQGIYDLTKRTIDELAQQSDVEYYGLRFATVCGWSPNLRVDLMLNKMVFDAKTTGAIRVSNANLMRPILGINDLGRAINAIIKSGKDLRGIYNLASFGRTVREMAEFVAARYDAEIELLPNTSPYVFDVDTSEFQERFNFAFKDTLPSIINSLDEPYERVGVRE